MNIKKIPHPDGDKLLNKDNNEFIGSLGKGKNAKVPTPQQIMQKDKDTEIVLKTSNIETQHKKFVSISKEPVLVGDKEIALKNEIFRTIVGSELTGLAIPGRGDRDEMGIYIELPEQVLGLAPTSEHYISRSVAQGEKSNPGDTDLTIYSLRKYLALAMAGNPTVVTILFAPKESILINNQLGEELLSLTSNIVSRKSGWKHLGYLDSQRKRMMGIEQQGKVPKRPELVDEYGYDVKFASHALRLGLQGIELMTTGGLILPLTQDNRKQCLDIKMGKVSFEDAVIQIDEVRDKLFSIMDSGKINVPDEPDYDKINTWMVNAQLRHWKILS